MKRLFWTIFFCLLTLAAFGQDDNNPSIIDIFMENFRKATPEVKLEILYDAEKMEVEGAGVLYMTAIKYTVDNVKAMMASATLEEICMYSIDQVRKRTWSDAKKVLWELFLVVDAKPEMRIAIIGTLTDIAPTDPEVIKNLNSFMIIMNEMQKTGKNANIKEVDACIQALGKIRHISSFGPLFMATIVPYIRTVQENAEKAMRLIPGDLKQHYLDILLEEPFLWKLTILKKALAEKNLTDAEKCSVAEFALNVALHIAVINLPDKDIIREIRAASSDFLGEKNWSGATPVIIEYLNRMIYDMDREIFNKVYLIKAIVALGNMKTHEAAKRLTIYLDLLNSYTEHKKPYDEQIVFAIVNSLKRLKDKVATSSLFYTRYLNYSEQIKKAALEALQALK